MARGSYNPGPAGVAIPAGASQRAHDREQLVARTIGNCARYAAAGALARRCAKSPGNMIGSPTVPRLVRVALSQGDRGSATCGQERSAIFERARARVTVRLKNLLSI